MADPQAELESKMKLLYQPLPLPEAAHRYVWEEPLPPAPKRGAQETGDERRARPQQHYCDYYRLLKKGMQQDLSVSARAFMFMVRSHGRH